MTDTPTTTAPDLTAVLNTVHGFLSLAEAELLYRLASEVPVSGAIVEVGAFQGRSTVALALGAKQAGATVWSIDNHAEYRTGDTQFGMNDNQHYYENVAKYQVGDVVKTLNLTSHEAYQHWRGQTIHLYWIDGKHDYENVSDDFKYFAWLVHPAGKIALHDTAGFHPGVMQLLNEILAAGEWAISEQVDATTVLRRVE
jgi:predicted O-methyltransferase YrrM